MSEIGVEIKPTFAGLVAAEEELGPLFALVERAASILPYRIAAVIASKWWV